MEVKLTTSDFSQVVSDAIRAVLENAPAYLLPYLLDYFLLQLQANDLTLKPPYQSSATLCVIRGTEETAKVYFKFLKLGCAGMHHFMIWTQVANVFGFTTLHYQDRCPEELVEDTGKVPLIQPINLDDVLALAFRVDDGTLRLKVGICVRKTEKQKGKGRTQPVGQKKLRLMTPKNMTLVQVPKEMVLSFFPGLERRSARHYTVDTLLAEDALQPRGY